MTSASPPAGTLPHVAVRATWRQWLELTKPKITVLMLVTCIAAMVVASDGRWPGFALVALVCFGLACSTGGASVLNHVVDRDLDRRMARTRRRPVASGAISPQAASTVGLALFTLGGMVLCIGVSPLTAWCALFGGAFYVLVYTWWLKRTTVLNTTLGGVAGAMPPLVGWVGAGGSLGDPMAWSLFAIMFAWQPAHFYPLSLLIRKDYAAAGFRMLPVVRGERVTVRATWRWTLIALATTVAPIALGEAGWLYGAFALLANAYLARRVLALVRADRARDSHAAVAGGDAADADADAPGPVPGAPDVMLPLLVDGPDSPGRIAARGAFLASMSWLSLLFLGLVADAVLL